jgi:hypothetical protein
LPSRIRETLASPPDHHGGSECRADHRARAEAPLGDPRCHDAGHRLREHALQHALGDDAAAAHPARVTLARQWRCSRRRACGTCSGSTRTRPGKARSNPSPTKPRTLSGLSATMWQPRCWIPRRAGTRWAGEFVWPARLSHGHGAARGGPGSARAPAWPRPAAHPLAQRGCGTVTGLSTTMWQPRCWMPRRTGTRWAGDISVADEVEPSRLGSSRARRRSSEGGRQRR